MTNADDIDAIGIRPDPDKLLAYHRQQLSAMLDGELSPDEAKFMLRRLQHDGQLAASWERWQVCGDVLRGRHHALLPSDFADRVAAGVSGRAPAMAEPMVARGPRFLRWGGGAALAASVALVAVFATRQVPDAQGPDVAPSTGAGSLVASGPDAAAEPQASPLMLGSAASPGTSPTAPSPASAGEAAVVALGAAAASQAPRRRAGQRGPAAPLATARREPQAASATLADAEGAAPAMPSIALATLDGVPAGRHAHPAFPPPPALEGRPWPRSLLPGAVDGGLNVGFAPGAGYALADPFLPRFGADEAAAPRHAMGGNVSASPTP